MARSGSAARSLTADQVSGSSSAGTCPPEPYLYQTTQQTVAGIAPAEPDCLWSGVKSIETHLLADSVNNMYDLTNPDMGYTYNSTTPTYDGSGAPPATQVSGADFGKMLRREFVSLNSVRNYNP